MLWERSMGSVWTVTWVTLLLALPGRVQGVVSDDDWEDPLDAVYKRCDRELVAANLPQPDDARVTAAWSKLLGCASRMLESHLNIAGRKLRPDLLNEKFPDHCVPVDALNAREIERDVSLALADFKAVSERKEKILRVFRSDLKIRGLLDRPALKDAYASLVDVAERLPLDQEESELYVQALYAVRNAARNYERQCGTERHTGPGIECGAGGCDFVLHCEPGSEVVIDRGMLADNCDVEALPLARGNRVMVRQGQARILVQGTRAAAIEIGLGKGSDIHLGSVKRAKDPGNAPVSELDFSIERGRLELFVDYSALISINGTIDGQSVLVARASAPREGRQFIRADFHFSSGNSVLVEVGHGLVSVTGPMGSRIVRSGESVRFDKGKPWD